MSNRYIFIGTIVLLVCVGLSGCNQTETSEHPDKAKFIGAWASEDDNTLLDLGKRVVFFSDGTLTAQLNLTGTFEIDEGNYLIVFIPIDGDVKKYYFDYQFTDEANTLTLLYLNEGRMYVYTRQ